MFTKVLLNVQLAQLAKFGPFPPVLIKKYQTFFQILFPVVRVIYFSNVILMNANDFKFSFHEIMTKKSHNGTVSIISFITISKELQNKFSY